VKKSQIFIIILILSIAFAGMSIRKTETTAAKRGKVIADSRSSIFNLNLNEASILSFWNSGAGDDIEGRVCILDDNGLPTNKYLPMVPRSFPSWFEFGCEDGNIVKYKIITRGPNDDWAQVIKITKKK
jgi:hypothetical protein